MANKFAHSHKALLSRQPLVFLNACETGTAGFFATGALNFPGTLLSLGARGVIATESPIWMLFGYHFGQELISHLFAGEEVSAALLTVRKEFLNRNNPLGLLYSYYGNPDVVLE
jgi:hypothetical protein